jgi:hypothetical protein
MKWLLVPLLWLAAVVVALAVLWRLWRGRNVVLRGRWSPRFVRMVVVVLVVLGVGVGKARPAPAPSAAGNDKPSAGPREDELPAAVTAEAVRAWLVLQQPTSPWSRFKKAYVKVTQSADKLDPSGREALEKLTEPLPEKFRSVVRGDLEALAGGKPPPRVSLGNLAAAADDLERAGYFDPWADAYLWRNTAAAGQADRNELVELYARLERHARVANTFIRAYAMLKPTLQPRAWQGKGGRPPAGWKAETDPQQTVPEMLGAAKVLYPTSDSGTWRKDGLALFSVTKDSPPLTLLRGGHRQYPPAGQEVRFGRLDLIETGDKPVVLEHAWLGRVELPAERLVSAWNLGEYLPDEAKARVKKAVADALGGSEDAAVLLERSLPLAQAAVREGLSKAPAAKGAPRLRLILSLFDDAVMPGPGEEAPAEEAPAKLKGKGAGILPADVKASEKAANPKE